MTSHRSLRKFFFFSFLMAAAVAVSFTAQAATVTENVTTTTDKNDNTGDLSLREALVAANTGLDDYVINLQAGAIYHLTIPPTATDDNGGTRGDLDLYRNGMNITINGNGATIDATGLGARIFQVVDISGAPGANVNLTLNDLILIGGDAGTADGGAIQFQGTDPSTSILTMNRCLVKGNKANNGGGLNLNTAKGNINNSTFTANVAAGNGGGISYGFGTININNSTLSGNNAAIQGGGLSVGLAGAVIRSSTITRNQAGGHGGGINGGDSGVNIKNSILSGNTATTADPECFGGLFSLTSNGYNIFGTLAGECVPAGPKTGDQNGISDPKLGDLLDNGGPTPTHLPLSGSPAIDKGDPAGCTDTAGAPLTTDQRGVNRMIDGDGDGAALCDVGSVEKERCGDGKVEGAEQCESGVCCDTATCKFKAANTACDDGNAGTTNDVCNATGTCQGTPPAGGGGGKSGGGCRLETGDVSGGSAAFILIGISLAGLVRARRREVGSKN